MAYIHKDMKCPVCKQKRDILPFYAGGKSRYICRACQDRWFVRLYLGFSNLIYALEQAWEGKIT